MAPGLQPPARPHKKASRLGGRLFCLAGRYVVRPLVKGSVPEGPQDLVVVDMHRLEA